MLPPRGFKFEPQNLILAKSFVVSLRILLRGEKDWLNSNRALGFLLDACEGVGEEAKGECLVVPHGDSNELKE